MRQMENIVDAVSIANIEYNSDAAEKVYVLICRFWKKGEKESGKEGQVYFILTSTEKEKIFNSIIERWRNENNHKIVGSDTSNAAN